MLQRGSVLESRSIFQLIIKLCDESDDISSKWLASQLRLAHANEGYAAGESNDYRACLNHANIWLAQLERRHLPSETSIRPSELGAAYSEVGVAHALLNNFETAEYYLLRSISTYKAMDIFQDTILVWPKLHIASIRWVQGRLSEAELILTEILGIQEKAFGINDTRSLL